MRNPATYDMYGQEVKAKQIYLWEGFQIAEWCNGKYVPATRKDGTRGLGLFLRGQIGHTGDWVVNTHDDTFTIMDDLTFRTHAELVRDFNE